jgi:hypothetical protein
MTFFSINLHPGNIRPKSGNIRSYSGNICPHSGKIRPDSVNIRSHSVNIFIRQHPPILILATKQVAARISEKSDMPDVVHAPASLGGFLKSGLGRFGFQVNGSVRAGNKIK